MTSESSENMGTPEEVERLYAEFVGHAHPASEPPDGFSEWVRNLHDVYLNVETAWLASLHVPPSDVERDLDDLGGSRRQRLARFLARDMWVLWEAWDRRPQYHEAFAERAPAQVGRLRELEKTGKARGWFQRVRNIRDYMNHRDQRDYLDAGREELPGEAITWMDDLRRTFSELLLAAMGMPIPRWEFTGVDDPTPRNSTVREIATSAVDDLLIGTVAAMHAGAEDHPDTTAQVSGHFGRAFTAAACGSPHVWSECLTALIRRSVVAWSRLGEVPELRGLVEEIDLEHNGKTFLAAITTAPAAEVGLPLAELSRLAVHRATAWFNGHGDLWATLGAAVSVAGVLASAATTLEPEHLDVEVFVQQLGAEADALLTVG
jgi:hypothetical protein